MSFEEIMQDAEATAAKLFAALRQTVADPTTAGKADWYHQNYVSGLEQDYAALEDETVLLREIVKILLDGEFTKTLTATDEQLDFYSNYDLRVGYTDNFNGTHQYDIKLT